MMSEIMYSESQYVQKTDTRSTEFCTMLSQELVECCSARQPHPQESARAPQRTQRILCVLYAFWCDLSSDILVKKAGRSGGGFERPGWRSPPGRRVNLSYMLGLF